MSEELMRIFAECTEAIEQDLLTEEGCLNKYPQYRTELADLLLVVVQARAVPKAYPTPEFRQQAQARLLAQLPPRPTTNNGAASVRHLFRLTGVDHTFTQQLQTIRAKLAQRWSIPLHPSLVVGGALLLVCILVISMWLREAGLSGKEAELSQSIPAASTEKIVPDNEAEDATPNVRPTSEVTAADSSETQTMAAIPDEMFSVFIPIISNPLHLNAQTAAVEVSQGFVEVQDADGQWTAVNRATTATAGQRVRTGDFSSAKISFHDGSQASLGPNTEISLDELNAQRPEDGFRTVVMTQWLGESEHHVDFRNDAGSRYEVMTPNGSGRARGTSFQVLVTSDLQTHYIVTEGRVDVTHLNVTVIVIAGHVTVIQPEQPPSLPHFAVFGQGEVIAMGDTWTIGGQTFTTSDSTIIVGNPQIGDIVSVSGYMLPDGTLVATHIILLHHASVNQFALTGEVESIGTDEWVIAGQSISVNDKTIIDKTLVVGDIARVYGTILADGALLAERIDRLDNSHPFEFVGIVTSIGADAWVIAGIDIVIDENTEIEGDIVIGDVVEVEGVVLADGTWLAHEIKLADDEAQFEFTGQVDNIDPWVVAGIPLETDSFTDIDSGIEVGDLVYVKGQILSDGTWLVTVIRLLSDDSVTFTIIGTVNSIEPWIVSGLQLAVDENTLIDDDIEVGTLVLAQGIFLPDGTLLATVIKSLEDDDDNTGCFTITTKVIGVNGDQITLEGLPPVTLDDDIIIDGDIIPNTTVAITVCISQDGTIIIISIVVIVFVPPIAPPPPAPPQDNGQPAGKVTICHYPPGNPSNRHTITVDLSAWINGHSGHADTLGACP
jgi:mannose-6-phosphate isomerase-like protein (cupin superfamily)